MDSEFDLIIVGGGVIGMSLACALQHLPLKIAIIEKVAVSLQHTADFDIRSLALSQSSRRIFSALDIWSEINQHVTPIQNIHISAKGHFAATRLCAKSWREHAFAYSVPMNRLSEILQARCKQFSWVKRYCPATLEVVELSKDNAKIILQHKDQRVQLKTKLLVAADGTNSTVRRLLGIGSQVLDYGEQAIVANVALARAHNQSAFERFTQCGAIAMLPLNKQHCAMVWAAPKPKALALIAQPEEQFLSQLQHYFGYRLGRFVKVGKRDLFPLKLVRANPKQINHLACIGNASQSLHPIAGQGFNLGLRDVAGLAQAIKDAYVANVALGSAAMLAQYRKQRKWDQRKLMFLTDSLVRLFSVPLAPTTLLRSLLLLTIDTIKPVRATLLEHVTGMAGRLPDLICGQPLTNQN